MINFEDLPELSSGSHPPNSGAVCAMEMVAFMERLPHSDRPPCTCPVLATYVRSLNDNMPDSERQRLKPILTRLVDTVNPDLEAKRAEHFAMSVATKLVPIALDGFIDPALVGAMRGAKDLSAAHEAARAARVAAHVAQASLSTRAAAYATYATYADAGAVRATHAIRATYAARAVRFVARHNNNNQHDFWQHAIDILIEAIELDPKINPAQWTHERVVECVQYVHEVSEE